MRGIKDRLLNQLPEVKWPTLGKTVDIPVYVIHNSADAEDYFFIFDFEQFVERSRQGMFVRPKLQVWAGRNDFARGAFARQFRESFTHEFEAARVALGSEKDNGRGWFSWSMGFDLLPSFVAHVVLLVALSAGKMVLSALPLPGFLRGKSDAEKLEGKIDEMQTKVDQALGDMQVVVHRDLRKHAYWHAQMRAAGQVDEDAWPLPAFVKTHLTDPPARKSRSWW
ncbi:hypothetical protein [Yoonia sp. SS1-5]|uniref:Uncharacterized protein n=1 Tax=Yoonia rhodophyticola TaxID=3137370 RepID=A0AAN0M6C9_9RHOB